LDHLKQSKRLGQQVPCHGYMRLPGKPPPLPLD
jgi:hypothetical protein